MIRLTTAFIAATLALAAPASAANVGDKITFTGPTVGCTDYGDAVEAYRLDRGNGHYRAIEFARTRDLDDYARTHRACIVFTATPLEWKIVDKAYYVYDSGGPQLVHDAAKVRGSAALPLLCIEPANPVKATPYPCFWFAGTQSIFGSRNSEIPNGRPAEQKAETAPPVTPDEAMRKAGLSIAGTMAAFTMSCQKQLGELSPHARERMTDIMEAAADQYGKDAFRGAVLAAKERLQGEANWCDTLKSHLTSMYH